MQDIFLKYLLQILKRHRLKKIILNLVLVFLGFIDIRLAVWRTHQVNNGFFVGFGFARLAEFVEELPTVHDGHIDVEQDQVGQADALAYFFLNVLDCLKPVQVKGRVDLDVVFGEQFLDDEMKYTKEDLLNETPEYLKHIHK